MLCVHIYIKYRTYLVFLVAEPPSLAAVGVAPRGRKLVEPFHHQRVIAARQAGVAQAVCLPLLQSPCCAIVVLGLRWVGKPQDTEMR